MAIRRLAALVVLVVLPACTADVLLGANHPRDGGSTDGAVDDGGTLTVDAGIADDGGFDAGGVDDGGVSDAGAFDAGVDDGGGLDAGAFDAGVDGGAMTDAGAPDGGLTDAGATDSGVFDGGVLDAGALDAGPPDLLPELFGVLAVERGDTVVFNAGVRNTGGSAALDASVSLTIPLGLSFRSGAGCVASTPQRVVCQVGDLAAQGVTTSALTLAADAGLGWRSIQALVASETADPQSSNDTATFQLAVTGVGTNVFTISAPRPAALDACFGSAVTAFAMCTPASLLSSLVTLLPDGGIDTRDAGYEGVWGQSTHERNVAFRFYFGTIAGRGYAGAAVSATCAEGIVDAAPTLPGAFRLCLQ
ncbi:MAG: hypothetical protein GQE15_33705 [Archangiaceae bacterium]|nr:hypothetical protein [Archangiaceae bacterium]